MPEESEIMKEIHKVREDFYRKTKGKDRQYILKLIKEGSRKVIQELGAVESDPKMIPKGKCVIPGSEPPETTYQVREREGKYEKTRKGKGHRSLREVASDQ